MLFLPEKGWSSRIIKTASLVLKTKKEQAQGKPFGPEAAQTLTFARSSTAQSFIS
jgi:hypothetical protein